MDSNRALSNVVKKSDRPIVLTAVLIYVIKLDPPFSVLTVSGLLES